MFFLARLHRPAQFTFIVLLSFITYHPASAQDDKDEINNNSDPLEQLDTMTVQSRPDTGYVPYYSMSATKTDTPLLETPQSVSVVTEQQIEFQDISTLGEALRYTPGIQGEPFGFEPRLTFLRIRGFDATTTGLYRNGLQLRNPNFAVSYSLEPYGAERIEIPRGPASVLFGAGSPGGLVNYVSKRPTQDTVREAGVELGSFDKVEGKFDLGGRLGDFSDFSYRLTGLMRGSDTQTDFINDDRLFLAPALTWQLAENTQLTLLGHFQEDDTLSSQALPAEGTLKPNPNGKIPFDRFTGEPGVDKYERSDYSAGYEFEHLFNDIWSFRQNATYYGNELNNVVVFSNSFAADQRTLGRALFASFGDMDGLALDNRLQAEFDTGPASHKLLFGIDYQHIDVSSLQSFGAAPPLDIFNPVYGAPVPVAPVFNDSGTIQEQLGFYIQDEIRFFEKWVLSLAVRYDDASTETLNNLTGITTEQDDNETTIRAGLLYLFDSGFAPYISYAESFLPSVGTDPAGRPFDPETGEQYEVGLKYQPPGSNSFVTAAYFDLTRKNFTETDPATFLAVQTGQIRSRGVELQGVASFDFGLNLIANYTFLDMEIEETVRVNELGERPTQTPEHSASLWADYALRQIPGFSVGAGVRYVGSSYGNLPNTFKLPAETIADASARYDWRQFRFQLNVKNLLDEEHVAGGFVRGADEFISVGAERTVTGSVIYRW